MQRQIIGDYTRRRLTLSKGRPQLTGINLLKKVSRGVQDFADDQLVKWQLSEVSKASAEGKEAGYQPNVTYQEGGTLTAQAFNDAAVSSVTTGARLSATSGMNELAEIYKNDPDSYQTESNALIEKQIGDLRGSIQTQDIARELEGQMRLTQQSTGYKISKTYMSREISQMKADTEMLTHTITTEAFKTAGGVFSKDITEQGIALNSFVVNRELLDASLHAVAPDGTPIYTAEGIQKRLDAFHSNFYSTAVQSWVSEAELTVEDLVKIRKGTLVIDMPGVGSINILDQLGQEDYEKKVISYTMTKMKEKQSLEKKIEDQEKETAIIDRDINDIEMIDNIYNGKGSATQVIQALKDGEISKSAANAAIKMLNNPNIVTTDDAYYNDLKINQIEGIDISDDLTSGADRLSPKHANELRLAVARENKTMQSEDEKWIVREMVIKNNFGISDPKTIRLAGDVVDMYRQQIADGIDREVAYQKARTMIDVMKDRANRALYNSVPKYSIVKNGTIDHRVTILATRDARHKGLITEDVYQIEMARLDALINEKKGGTDG